MEKYEQMKVVINVCYGGFGLSNEAVEECLAKGMKLTKYDSEGHTLDKDAHFVESETGFLGMKYYPCNGH